jgi:hypothetical protein
MGKLKEGALKFVICFITGFLAGVLAGIAVLSVIVSYRTDNYYKQISYLEHIIRDKDERLEKLEKSINTQNHIIKDIEVNLIFDKNGDNDEIDSSSLSSRIVCILTLKCLDRSSSVINGSSLNSVKSLFCLFALLNLSDLFTLVTSV